MKNLMKSAFGLAAAVATIGASFMTPLANVVAWGDSDGGRASYTIQQINEGVLGDKIVFNSIKDGTIGDEKNFVGTREDNGINAGTQNVWNGNSINVEDGKTYIVRLYVHNNNPKGADATATGVTTTFNVPNTIGKSIEVNGFIDTDNATPKTYWDYVVFKSDRNFSLSYVSGSALLENNGIGKNGGVKLSDNIVTSSGVKIGYDALDGKVPGCFQYANYVTIKVKAEFQDSFSVTKKVRLAGTKGWQEIVTAKIGDKVEYQIGYKNLSGQTAENVVVKDILPKNMTYVKGSTKLYNANHPDGVAVLSDTVTTTGINIGSYTSGSNAYVRFAAIVTDKNLVCGNNKLVNWAQIGVGDETLQDSADVAVAKVCPIPEPPQPPVIPKTGPESVIVSVIGAGAIVTSAGYYLVSRKSLRR